MTPLRPEAPPVRGAVIGTVYLVAVALALDGVLQVLRGVAALDDGTPGGLRPTILWADRPTLWGSIHLIVGIGLLVVAIGVIRGSTRALVSTAVVVVVAAIASFLSIPVYPAWGVIGLGLNAVALYAIATVGTTGPWAASGPQTARPSPSPGGAQAGRREPA